MSKEIECVRNEKNITAYGHVARSEKFWCVFMVTEKEWIETRTETILKGRKFSKTMIKKPQSKI